MLPDHAKRITAADLALIAAALAVDPDCVGEGMPGPAHQRYLQDLAKVISDHCGGTVIEPDEQTEEGGIFVVPDESLPSLETCVWTVGGQPEAWAEATDPQGDPTPFDIKSLLRSRERFRMDARTAIITAALAPTDEDHYACVSITGDASTERSGGVSGSGEIRSTLFSMTALRGLAEEYTVTGPVESTFYGAVAYRIGSYTAHIEHVNGRLPTAADLDAIEAALGVEQSLRSVTKQSHGTTVESFNAVNPVGVMGPRP